VLVHLGVVEEMYVVCALHFRGAFTVFVIAEDPFSEFCNTRVCLPRGSGYPCRQCRNSHTDYTGGKVLYADCDTCIHMD
jgi:hypothetical protein